MMGPVFEDFTLSGWWAAIATTFADHQSLQVALGVTLALWVGAIASTYGTDPNSPILSEADRETAGRQI